ncbi:Hypothetical predicted protein, partial [Scomber scombrus]
NGNVHYVECVKEKDEHGEPFATWQTLTLNRSRSENKKSYQKTALGLIWFGFSMNYHGLDPVSADKAPKMSQLYPYPPYEYSTTCSHLPIVFSFVLVSDSAGDNVLEEDVAKGSGIDI